MAKNNLPSLFSCNGSIKPGYGVFYGVNSDRPTEETPVLVYEETVLGTISNYINVDKEKAERELNPDNANPKTVDKCHLPPNTDILRVKTSINFRGTLHAPHACNESEFVDLLYGDLLSMEETKQLVKPLAERYVANIINGKWLHRNQYAVDIGFKVLYNNETYVFPRINGFDVSSLNGEQTEAYNIIVNGVYNTLISEDEVLNLYIVADIQMTENAEVYPSQEFETNGDKKKILFSINENHAAMHSQKIGNGIRTIDNWIDPNVVIPVNPYGQIKEKTIALRKPDTKKDLYTLLQHIDEMKTQAINGDPDNNVKFLIACLIRGGVYSGVAKKKK